MKFLCLCPTYGRPQHLLDNALYCFKQQTHANKFLLFYDDLGNVRNQFQSNWAVISTTTRCPHLPAKYHEMIELADLHNLFPGWAALAVWDDDDLYLPNYLTALSYAMEKRKWAKPSYVFSTYGMHSGEVQLEPATGRFHGSVGVRRTTGSIPVCYRFLDSRLQTGWP